MPHTIKSPTVVSQILGCISGLCLGVVLTLKFIPAYIAVYFQNRLGGFLCLIMTFAIMICLANTIQIVVYTFDIEHQKIRAEYWWLRIYRSKIREFGFEDIAEINGTYSGQIVLQLQSGRRVYIQTNSPSSKRRFQMCDQVASILGKRETSAGIWS